MSAQTLINILKSHKKLTKTQFDTYEKLFSKIFAKIYTHSFTSQKDSSKAKLEK